jgi:hypothetical protein
MWFDWFSHLFRLGTGKTIPLFTLGQKTNCGKIKFPKTRLESGKKGYFVFIYGNFDLKIYK